MQAVVFHGEGDVRVESVPDPTIVAPDDAIVKVRTAAICGSDLHILHGRVPGVFEGSTMGHELVGEVVAVGDEVARYAVGDEVIGSFQISCGTCRACRGGRWNLCEQMGTLGYGIFLGDLGGAQAEYVRIPHADVNLLAKPPEVSDDAAVFVGDVLTTGWYCAGIAGIAPDDDVLVVGAGPVGLCAAMAAAQLGGHPVVTDMVAARLQVARDLGARTIDSSQVDLSVAIEELLGGRPPVVLETVGRPEALVDALYCCANGGTVSVIGVHTEFEHPLPLQNMFARALTVRFGGSCNVQGTWEHTLHAVRRRLVDPTQLITHHLPLADAAEGYRLFDAREALKVILTVG